MTMPVPGGATRRARCQRPEDGDDPLILSVVANVAASYLLAWFGYRGRIREECAPDRVAVLDGNPRAEDGNVAEEHSFGFDTRAIHAGQRPDPETGSRAMPIYATSSFVFDDAQHAADLFALQTFGNIYTRIGNPTTAAFEERMASLEGGLGAVATASGQAAQLISILTLARQGDELVASNALYGGTYTQFDVTLRRMGVNVTFVDFSDLNMVEKSITESTKALYAETIGNPGCDILDIARYADMAHEHGIPLIVDSTFATPYLCRPIEHGADIVVHSATKFIGGHGAVIAGVIVEAGTFPYDNGNFPLLVDPSPAYHDLRFWENFREYGYLTRARVELLRDVGASLSPFNAFLLLIGLETPPTSDAAPCGERRSGCAVPARTRGRSLGQLSDLRSQPLDRPGAGLPPRGAGSRLHVRARGGLRSGCASHRKCRTRLPSRQRRRRQDAGDSPRIDYSPAGPGRGAKDCGNRGRHDPYLGRQSRT